MTLVILEISKVSRNFCIVNNLQRWRKTLKVLIVATVLSTYLCSISCSLKETCVKETDVCMENASGILDNAKCLAGFAKCLYNQGPTKAPTQA